MICPRLSATVLVTLVGCSACDRMINVPPMRRYAERLVTASGARLTVDRCAMFHKSRKGFCVLAGPPSDIAAFTKGLKLAPTRAQPVYGDLSCLALVDFGERDGKALVTKKGITQFVATESLPSNTDNVRLVSVYTDAASVCVEMEYPYG
jgi:hypothetical protein